MGVTTTYGLADGSVRMGVAVAATTRATRMGRRGLKGSSTHRVPVPCAILYERTDGVLVRIGMS